MTATEVRLSVSLPDDFTVAFCSSECLLRWRVATAARYLDSAVLADEPQPAELSCYHCGWCALLVAEPGDGCVLHDDGCPPADWRATVSGARACRDLAELRGGGLDDTALAALDEVAWELLIDYEWPHAEKAVARAWARLLSRA